MRIAPRLLSRKLHSQGSDASSEGKGLPSQRVTQAHAGLVEASLLATLEDQGAPLDRISVYVLRLGSRANNALKKAHINTIQQLINRTESDLLSIQNIGTSSAEEIKNKLNSYLAGMLRKRGKESQIMHRSVSHAEVRRAYLAAHPRAKQTEGQAIPSVQATSLCSLSEAVDTLLEGLGSSRHGTIVRLRYGLDDGISRTLEEVGQRLGVTRERVRQIEQKILRRIYHPSRRHIRDRIVQPFELVLEQAGGILREQRLAEKISDVAVLGEVSPVGARTADTDT